MASYQQQRSGGSYQSSRIQLSPEEQDSLIENRIAQHTTRVQGVEALTVFAFVYIKEGKTTMNGNTYCDVDFQIPVESPDGESRVSEYISVRMWGDEVQAIQQCAPYFVNDRGKPKPILISYAPSKLQANIGMNKVGQPQAYLKADRVAIFLDVTSTLVVSNRNEEDAVQEQEEQPVSSSSSPESEIDDTPF